MMRETGKEGRRGGGILGWLAYVREQWIATRMVWGRIADAAKLQHPGPPPVAAGWKARGGGTWLKEVGPGG